MDVLACVRRFIRQHELIGTDARIVAAVSGGSDSVALAWILHALHAAGELALVGIAHFNHQLRETADRDERHVAALAEAIDVPLLADREDVARRAAAERRSIEDAARTARYLFFERALDHFRADVVALGHTRDDQAETYLLRLLRGAGPRGFSGMHPRSGRVVRPLLGCRRDALRDYLARKQQEGLRAAWIEDESNTDVTILRNRVRAELIPVLATRFNPSIVEVLADEAALQRELWQWLDDETRQAACDLVHIQGNARVIDLDALRSLDAPVQRALVWRTMTDTGGGRPVSFAHVADALLVANPRGPASVDAPGQRVQRIGSRLVLESRPPAARSARTGGSATANLFRYPLSIPGEVQLPDAGWIVSARPATLRDAVPLDPCAAMGNGLAACVRADLLPKSLAVRNRRPGDRFRPAGFSGRRKLQDFFVDRKIERQQRDLVPLVVDDADRIVWVAGHRIDEAFRVTGGSDHVLLLTLKALGGSA